MSIGTSEVATNRYSDASSHVRRVMEDRLPPVLPPPSSSAYPLGLQPFFSEDASAAAVSSSTSSYVTAPSTPSPAAPAAPAVAMPPPRLDPSVGAVNALLMQTTVPFSSKIYNVDRWRKETPPATMMALPVSMSATHYGIGGIGSGDHSALSPLPPEREIDEGHERRRPPPFTPFTSPPPPPRSKCS